MCSHHTHLIAEGERVALMEGGRLREGTLQQVRQWDEALFERPEEERAEQPQTQPVSSLTKTEHNTLYEEEKRERGRVGLSVYKAFFGSHPYRWLVSNANVDGHFLYTFSAVGALCHVAQVTYLSPFTLSLKFVAGVLVLHSLKFALFSFGVTLVLQLYIAQLASGNGSLSLYALLSLFSSVLLVVKVYEQICTVFVSLLLCR